MAISVHINGKSLKKMTSGMQEHQERFSEKEALKVLENTTSGIDVSQSKYNVLLFKNNELGDKSVIKFVRDELYEVNEKRKANGQRAFRPDANSIGVGTLQISDDTLEKIGFDKSKKWSEQSEQARENVKTIYSEMVRNAVSKPDFYGKMLTATLHVDEGTPHVDFMSTGVDRDRPDWSLREVLNGKEWRDENNKRRFPKKGEKLRALQDDLDTIFSNEYKKQFGLHRGEPESKKVDFARKTRKAKKQIEAKSKAIEQREAKLNEREIDLNERQRLIDVQERHLKVRQDKLTEDEQKRSERLVEAHRALEDVRRENDRLTDEIARKRAEIAKLDGLELSNVDKLVLNLLKTMPDKNIPGASYFDFYQKMAIKQRKDQTKSVPGVVDAVSELDSGKSRTQDLARGRRVLPRNNGRQFGD